jgi:hypothetical protein
LLKSPKKEFAMKKYFQAIFICLVMQWPLFAAAHNENNSNQALKDSIAQLQPRQSVDCLFDHVRKGDASFIDNTFLINIFSNAARDNDTKNYLINKITAKDENPFIKQMILGKMTDIEPDAHARQELVLGIYKDRTLEPITRQEAIESMKWEKVLSDPYLFQKLLVDKDINKDEMLWVSHAYRSHCMNTGEKVDINWLKQFITARGKDSVFHSDVYRLLNECDSAKAMAYAVELLAGMAKNKNDKGNQGGMQELATYITDCGRDQPLWGGIDKVKALVDYAFSGYQNGDAPLNGNLKLAGVPYLRQKRAQYLCDHFDEVKKAVGSDYMLKLLLGVNYAHNESLDPKVRKFITQGLDASDENTRLLMYKLAHQYIGDQYQEYNLLAKAAKEEPSNKARKYLSALYTEDILHGKPNLFHARQTN